MPGEHGREKGGGSNKIKIGRLHVDPVFLLIFLFFAASAGLLLFFLWLAG
jgi:hypothetical protein